jgi:hypothetical protein
VPLVGISPRQAKGNLPIRRARQRAREAKTFSRRAIVESLRSKWRSVVRIEEDAGQTSTQSILFCRVLESNSVRPRLVRRVDGSWFDKLATNGFFKTATRHYKIDRVLGQNLP